MVPNPNKQVALVAIDRDMYIENVWPYSMTKMCTKSAKTRPIPFLPKYSNNYWN